MYATMPGLCSAGDRTQGFLLSWQTLCQPNYIPSLFKSHLNLIKRPVPLSDTHHNAEPFGDFVKTQVSDINIKSLILRYRVELENLLPNEFHDAAGIPGAETPLCQVCLLFCVPFPSQQPTMTRYQWHQRKPMSLTSVLVLTVKKKMILLPQSHIGPRFLLPYSRQHFAVLHGCL